MISSCGFTISCTKGRCRALFVKWLYQRKWRYFPSTCFVLEAMLNLFTKWKDISPNYCTNFLELPANMIPSALFLHLLGRWFWARGLLCFFFLLVKSFDENFIYELKHKKLFSWFVILVIKGYHIFIYNVKVSKFFFFFTYYFWF